LGHYSWLTGSEMAIKIKTNENKTPKINVIALVVGLLWVVVLKMEQLIQ